MSELHSQSRRGDGVEYKSIVERDKLVGDNLDRLLRHNSTHDGRDVVQLAGTVPTPETEAKGRQRELGG